MRPISYDDCDTIDRIFLLSADEVQEYRDRDRYRFRYGDDSFGKSYDKFGNSVSWLTRTRGKHAGTVTKIDNLGFEENQTNNADASIDSDNFIRPALWMRWQP